MEERNPVGRPVGFSPGKRYTVLKQCLISETMDRDIKARAKANGVTASATIRNALKAYLGKATKKA